MRTAWHLQEPYRPVIEGNPQKAIVTTIHESEGGHQVRAQMPIIHFSVSLNTHPRWKHVSDLSSDDFAQAHLDGLNS